MNFTERTYNLFRGVGGAILNCIMLYILVSKYTASNNFEHMFSYIVGSIVGFLGLWLSIEWIITGLKSQRTYSLKELVQTSTKGWNVDLSKLRTCHKRPVTKSYIFDDFIESKDKKFACLFYDIHEYRMGCYTGLIAVFVNKENPKLLANPIANWFDYQFERSLQFQGNFLILRTEANHEESALSGTPFVIIDLSQAVFYLVEFDASSVYYSLKIESTNMFSVELDAEQEVENRNLDNKLGQKIDLTELIPYPIEELNNCPELYWKEKKRQPTQK